MADTNKDWKVTDARVTQTSVASPDNVTGDYGSVSVMRARLTTLNAGLYTTAKLNNMTANDMRYAIRLADDPTGIRQ